MPANYEAAIALLLKQTIAANEAKSTVQRYELTAERRGIIDTIESIWNAEIAGRALLSVDSVIMAGDKQNHPLNGGLFLDWEPDEDCL